MQTPPGTGPIRSQNILPPFGAFLDRWLISMQSTHTQPSSTSAALLTSFLRHARLVRLLAQVCSAWKWMSGGRDFRRTDGCRGEWRRRGEQRQGGRQLLPQHPLTQIIKHFSGVWRKLLPLSAVLRIFSQSNMLEFITGSHFIHLMETKKETPEFKLVMVFNSSNQFYKQTAHLKLIRAVFHTF